MKRLLILVLLVCTGCTGQWQGTKAGIKVTVKQEFPVVNPPAAIRQGNWHGDKDEGSCVHATMVTLLRWQGRYNTADQWQRTHGNGEWPASLAAELDREHIRYAYTTAGDVAFLEWACRTRRGCGITVMGGEHMIALVHLDDKWAGLLDDNDVTHYVWVPREQLIAEWRASNGWAVTPVYSPAAPLPPSS
jgi:hypothetical protein